MTDTNEFGQPVGAAVDLALPRPAPGRVTLRGEFCTLQPLDASEHAASLFAAYDAAADDSAWTYIGVGPFGTPAEYRAWADGAAASADPLHFAVVDNASGAPLGTLSLMRIDTANAVIEVGFVVFSPAMQRTALSTEAHALLMRYAFDELGYRRYEWKCDALNEPSRRAAERLGFSYEGTFRRAAVVKGRSRDTAWFSIVDAEWPALSAAFDRWLDPANFGQAGEQLSPLRAR